MLGAFFLIYFIWGSNFLAIRYAIETIPPFLLMGVRSMLAGLCLYLWASLRSAERPTLAHWRAAAVVGVLLFLGCHGLLAWAQQRVPSGVAALGMATLPLWMTLLDWLWAGAAPARPAGLARAHPGASRSGRARRPGQLGRRDRRHRACWPCKPAGSPGRSGR